MAIAATAAAAAAAAPLVGLAAGRRRAVLRGARPAEHGLAGRKVTVLDLKAYYEKHDQAKATDANCKKLLSSYTDDEIFKALERKYKSPLMRAIDLDDF